MFKFPKVKKLELLAQDPFVYLYADFGKQMITNVEHSKFMASMSELEYLTSDSCYT